MATQSKWVQARIIAQSQALPPVCEIGKQVAISLADCGVRVWGMGMAPRVLTLEEAGRVLATERADGHLVPADSGQIEAEWGAWFGASKVRFTC